MTTDDECPFEHAEDLALKAVKDPELIPQYLQAQRTVLALEGGQGWKGNRKMSQNELILNHMRKRGYITMREALMDYSIQSLTRRISDLRERGHNIVTDQRRHPVTGQEYTRYSLAA